MYNNFYIKNGTIIIINKNYAKFLLENRKNNISSQLSKIKVEKKKFKSLIYKSPKIKISKFYLKLLKKN